MTKLVIRMLVEQKHLRSLRILNSVQGLKRTARSFLGEILRNMLYFLPKSYKNLLKMGKKIPAKL